MERLELLRAFNSVLNDGVYVFATAPPDADISAIPHIASFREREGSTVVCSEHDVLRAGLTVLFRAGWITLTVPSDLNAVGLTAAVSAALAAAGIPCNIVAAAHHDHVFVPIETARSALTRLRPCQSESWNPSGLRRNLRTQDETNWRRLPARSKGI